MDTNTLLSVVSAVAGAFAAIAACFSARTAEKAAKHAENMERQGRIRDVHLVAHKILAETMRVESLVQQLNVSKSQAFATNNDNLLHGITCFQQEAIKFIENKDSLQTLAEEAMTNHLTKFDGYLVHILRAKEKLMRDLESIRREKE